MRWLPLCALLCATAPVVHAQDECPELTDAQVRARLNRAIRDVDREEPAMRRWWTTFALLHATMATATAILAGSAATDQFRDSMLVNMASSLLGLASLLVLPPPLMGAGDGLRALPDSTPEERLAKLRAAEGVLGRTALQTDFLRDWFPGVASATYITGASLVQLLLVRMPGAAFLHAIGGVFLGLGRILLYPTGGRDAWRSYHRAYPDAECAPHTRAPDDAMRWALVPSGVGLGFVVSF